MTKRVLVTGSEGFTGRYVCDEFARAGWEVWGAGLQPQPDRPHYLQIDLLKPETLTRIVDIAAPDVVIHLAASAFIAEADPTVFYQINLLGTRNLLEALSNADRKPECIILASSANVYGNADKKYLSEDDPPQPANDYAVSKLAMEYLAKTYKDKLGIVIARPFNYTGVGQDSKFLIPKIVSHFRDNAKVIELGNLNVAREFCDVRDIATYYRKIAEVKPCNLTVNLCSGRAHTLLEVLEAASSISGQTLEVTINPKFVRQNEVPWLCGNPSRLTSLISEYNPTSLNETLQWMLLSSG
jgi:nucleoside-diphosphate-sugar epimerase